MVDLSRIDLATEEDRKYHIHEWAMLFKARTWEEMKMLAARDEYLQEASETIFRMSADDLVRKRCLDREEYYQDLRSYERKIELDRIEHEQDLRNYERKIELDRIEHEQDLRNYEKKIEQDRLAHEQDKRNYEKKIEQDRLEYEQDKRSYEKKIEQNRLAHEQTLLTLAERDAQIQQLQAQLEALKKQNP